MYGELSELLNRSGEEEGVEDCSYPAWDLEGRNGVEFSLFWLAAGAGARVWRVLAGWGPPAMAGCLPDLALTPPPLPPCSPFTPSLFSLQMGPR